MSYMDYYADLNLKDTATNAKEIKEYYDKNHGYCFNITGTLRKVLCCSPDFYSIKNYNNPIAQMTCEKDGGDIDHEKAKAQHKEMLRTYLKNGVDVELLEPTDGCIYQVFARDFGGCIREGAILGTFKEPQRWPETPIWEQRLKDLGIPIAARCTAGVIEGGDFAMIGDHCCVFGLIDRSDKVGFDSVAFQLEELGYECLPIRLPHKWLHLDATFNVISEHVVLMCKQIMPPGVIEKFERRDYDIIDFPPEDILGLNANVEAIGKSRVISASSDVKMNAEMDKHGIEVIEVDVSEIMRGGGCIHCMTFPLLRDRD
jgi:N-dimethylarginine dimethylaminohydrolase